MPKRDSITEKWNDPWFRRLDPAAKLVFLWCCDNCDIAGFVEYDPDLIAFQTGLEASAIEGALKPLERGLIAADNWLWVRTFIKNQGNLPLNPSNRCHEGIINRLELQKVRFSKVLEEIEKQSKASPLKAPSKGLQRGTGKGKGNGNGKQRGGVGERVETVWEIKQRIEALESIRGGLPNTEAGREQRGEINVRIRDLRKKLAGLEEAAAA